MASRNKDGKTANPAASPKWLSGKMAWGCVASWAVIISTGMDVMCRHLMLRITQTDGVIHPARAIQHTWGNQPTCTTPLPGITEPQVKPAQNTRISPPPKIIQTAKRPSYALGEPRPLG